jgi:2-polyprenylphenol 6-hydroxylase
LAEHYDVIVTGGGLVGATAALALARQGRSVALVDRQQPVIRAGTLGFDLRTVALNEASEHLLTELGVWHRLEPCRYRRVVVWEENGTAMLTFRAEDAGADSLGALVETGPATAKVWEVAGEEPHLAYVQGEVTAVQTVDEAVGRAGRPVHQRAAPGVTVVLGDRSLRGHLLLAADGSESTVRRLLGVPVELQPTPHAAVVTIAETAESHGGAAYQRFLRDGPLALLPLPSRAGRHFCSVVWSQSHVEAERRMQLDERAFRAELEWASESRLGAVRAVDRRVTFVLRQQLSSTFFPAPGVVLLGDAARVLHPLAGQGVNVGLEDVRELAALAAALDASDLGDPLLWRGYARRRRLRARLMLRAMDLFRTAYALDGPVLQWLRNVAVSTLDGVPRAKRSLIDEARGRGAFSLRDRR